MSFKGYYAFDIIETDDGKFKIIDTHGLSDAVSFSERAGYHPRESRIDKFVKLLAQTKRDGKVLYLFSQKETRRHLIPSCLREFYRSLPNGFPQLGWIEAERRSEAKLRENTSGTSLFKKELQFLAKSAKRNGLDFVFGPLEGYFDKGIVMDSYDLSRMTQRKIAVPWQDAGLIVIWGHDIEIHPERKANWLQRKIDINTPIVNPENISYALSPSVPKWTFRIALEKIIGAERAKEVFPNETYIGMGLTRSEGILSFFDYLRLGKSRGEIVAVRKPLFAHRGLDVDYLDTKGLEFIADQEKQISAKLGRVREKFRKKINEGFRYDHQYDGIVPLWFNEKGRVLLPVAEIASYTLQEFLNAKPVHSKKTEKDHQGVIRAQVFRDNTVSVMHRLSSAVYDPGKFVPLTDGVNPTFWERSDDETERRVYEFLSPILGKFEEGMEKLSSVDIFNLGRDKVRELYSV